MAVIQVGPQCWLVCFRADSSGGGGGSDGASGETSAGGGGGGGSYTIPGPYNGMAVLRATTSVNSFGGDGVVYITKV